MQRNFILIVSLVLFFSLFISGCTNKTPLETPGVEIQLVTETLGATKMPEPTSTVTPTEVPIIPCRVVYDTNRDGNWEIYVVNPDGSGTLNLTNDAGDDWNASWSADGRRIAFVSNRDNGADGGQAIYVMNADGSDVRQVSVDYWNDWPDWSPDGKMITYVSDDNVFVIEADGTAKPINLTDSSQKDARPVWSPDGSRIAWMSGEDYHQNIFVMNADGSNVQQITDQPEVYGFNWTVDGRLLTGWDSSEQNQICDNCVVNIEDGSIVEVGGKGELAKFFPFWTESGDLVELANMDVFEGNNEIYLLGEGFPDSLDIGIGNLNLTNNPADDRNADWPAECGPRNKAAILAAKFAEAQPTEVPPTPEPVEIVLGYAGDDPAQWQRKNNFQKACEELGIQCIYGEIPELIKHGVSAIVQNSSAATVEDLHEDILDAKENGIPVFILDAETETDGAYSVTMDYYQWTEISIKWMFETMGKKGSFAFYNFQPDTNQKVVIGDMLDKYPDIKEVAKRENDFDRDNIFPDVAEIMKANPDLGAIWASENMSDVVFAVMDIGLPGKEWPLLMCEATKAGLFIWSDRLKDFPGMHCIAVSNPPGIAYDAAYAAYYLASGAQIDESVLSGKYGRSLYVNIPVVTDDNLQEWMKIINYEDDQFIPDELMDPQQIREDWFLN
jgi:ABC-type sugar transport system substrate-binding protein